MTDRLGQNLRAQYAAVSFDGAGPDVAVTSGAILNALLKTDEYEVDALYCVSSDGIEALAPGDYREYPWPAPRR